MILFAKVFLGLSVWGAIEAPYHQGKSFTRTPTYTAIVILLTIGEAILCGRVIGWW